MKKRRRPLKRTNDSLPDLKHPQVRKTNINIFLFFFKLFIIVAIISSLVTFLFTYSLFNIKDYEITGIKWTEAKQAEEIVSKYKGKNIFAANKFILSAQLGKINECRYAKIKKLYPNRLSVRLYEEVPVCAFKNSNGIFLVNEKGCVFHKYNRHDPFLDCPVLFSENNNIKSNYSITDDKDFHTNFLFDLGKTCYYNHLNISYIKIKNKKQVIMASALGFTVNFGATSDIIDKVYLLKQIFNDKHEILNKIDNIYIIDSKRATYKLKQTSPDQITANSDENGKNQ